MLSLIKFLFFSLSIKGFDSIEVITEVCLITLVVVPSSLTIFSFMGFLTDFLTINGFIFWPIGTTFILSCLSDDLF